MLKIVSFCEYKGHLKISSILKVWKTEIVEFANSIDPDEAAHYVSILLARKCLNSQYDIAWMKPQLQIRGSIL